MATVFRVSADGSKRLHPKEQNFPLCHLTMADILDFLSGTWYSDARWRVVRAV